MPVGRKSLGKHARAEAPGLSPAVHRRGGVGLPQHAVPGPRGVGRSGGYTRREGRPKGDLEENAPAKPHWIRLSRPRGRSKLPAAGLPLVLLLEPFLEGREVLEQRGRGGGWRGGHW